MTIESDHVAPHGWYQDPLESTLLRWWDGGHWTTVVTRQKQPMPGDESPADTPDLQFVPPNAAPQLVNAPAPTGDPRTPVVPIRNMSGWLALAFGLVAIAAVLWAVNLHQFDDAYLVPALVAIFWGLSGVVRVRARYANNLLASVMGLVLGGVAIVIFSIGGAIMEHH